MAVTAAAIAVGLAAFGLAEMTRPAVAIAPPALLCVRIIMKNLRESKLHSFFVVVLLNMIIVEKA